MCDRIYTEHENLKKDYFKSYQEGDDLYAEKKYSEALTAFKEAAEINGTNNCVNYVGCCYMQLGDFESAEVIFQALIKFADWERPVFNLGRIYLKQKKYDKALECFKKAQEINPNNEDVYFYLGRYHQAIENYDSATGYFMHSLSINDNQPETHLNIGICYYKVKDFDKAIFHFNKAMEYDSNEYDALFYKAIVLVTIKEYSEALEIFKQLQQTEGFDEDVTKDIAYCESKIKD